MAKTKDAAIATPSVIEIMEVQRGELELYLLGSTPGLIMNRQSEKVKRELLMPKRKLSKSERERNLKHDPVAEFRAAPYVLPDSKAPTFLAMPATAFKGAMRQAAMDAGGMKSQIGRLLYVPGDMVPVYGNPLLFMSVTRSAGMQRTPDVRTRALLKEWAVKLSARFVRPHLAELAVARLAAAAGEFIGVGDWRTEKGAGSYGGWRIVGADDPTLKRIMASWGRDAQKAAMEEAVCADQESEDLLSWYEQEAKDRGFKITKREAAA